jgi:cobalt-zinc-cadmium resistance protein CzcA
MMTAATTVLGLAPFLVATGLGSEIQKPLAVVVIFGLTTATMMTMVVMPMIYRWFDDIPDQKAPEQNLPESLPLVDATQDPVKNA